MTIKSYKSGTYAYQKEWRKNNPLAYYEQKRRYNERTLKTATLNRKHYTPKEIEIILDKSKTAREIAKLLNRSYYAIEQARQRHK